MLADPPTIQVDAASDLSAAAVVLDLGTGGAVTQASVDAFPVAGFTLSFWIRTTNTTDGVVIVSYDAANPATRLTVKTPSNLAVAIGAQSTGATGISVADGSWHQVTLTLAPSAGSRYALALYKDGVPCWYSRGALPGAPALRTGGAFVLGQGIGTDPSLTGQLSELRLLTGVMTESAVMTATAVRISATAPGAVIVWALTSAATSGQLSGAATFVASSPALAFRLNRRVVATFSDAGSGATYDLQWSASNGRWFAPLTGLPHAPVTLVDFDINVRYTAVVRAVTGDTPGPWSQPSTANAIDLGQPATTLSQPDPTHVQLSWPPVDQASAYALAFYKNGASTPQTPPSGTQTGQTFDLTPLVTGTDSWTYTAAATVAAQRVTGPLTPVVAVTAPQLTFTYDWALGTDGVLAAAWTNSDNASQRYLTITKNAAPQVASLLPSSTLGYTVTTPVASGETWVAQLRALQSGAIGPWTAPVSVTVYQLLGPTIDGVAADGTAHTLTVRWTPAAGGPGGQQFALELWSADRQTLLQTVSPAASPQVVTNPAIVDGASFNVRVRAYAATANSYGRWSAYWPVTVNGVPQVQDVVARSNASGDVTVSWAAVTGFSGVTYVARIYGNGVDYSAPATAATTVTLLQTATRVVVGSTYNVTVTASATGRPSGPPSEPVAIEVKPGGNPPPPPTRTGDPIDPSNGAFTYVNEELAVYGVVPLILTTYYNSSQPTAAENPLYVSALGNRWSHGYATRLAVDSPSRTLYVLWGNMAVHSFGVPSSITGTYANTGAPQGTSLVLSPALVYTLTMRDQTRYRFDSAGKLLAIIDRFGRQTSLGYDGAQLSTVTDDSTGKKLTFHYSGAQLSSVTDDNGRSVGFSYQGSDLHQVTDVMGGTRTFNYTGASLIETIIDQRGNTAVKNTYTNGRVTFQQDARALAAHASYGITLGYTTGTTPDGLPTTIATMTDRAGHVVVYTTLQANRALLSVRYDLGDGNVQVESMTYNGFNVVTSRTRYTGPASAYTAGAGNATSSSYDGNGNLTLLSVALPGGGIHATTRTYDAANNVRTIRVYEGPAGAYSPTAGNLTTNDYYADNTLKSMTDPLGRVISFTYWDGAIPGLVKTFTDPLGNVYDSTYEAGLLHQLTSPFRESVVYQYDGAGVRTLAQYNDAAGARVLSTRASFYAGAQLKTWKVWLAGQSEDEAFVSQYFYDANGNPEREIDPQNVATVYQNDPNNLLSRIEYALFREAKRTIDYEYDRDDFLQRITYSAAVRPQFQHDVLGRMTTYTDPMAFDYRFSELMVTNAAAPYLLRRTRTWPRLAGADADSSEVTVSDPLERIVQIIDRGGNVTDVAYTPFDDAASGTQRMRVVVTFPPAQPGGARTTLERTYDAAGRLISIRDQSLATTTIAWTAGTDAVTNTKTEVVTATDAQNRQEVATYDAFGRLIRRDAGRVTGAEPQFASWIYGYDVISRLTVAAQSQGTTSILAQFSYAWDAASKTAKVSIGRPGRTSGATEQFYNGSTQLVRQLDPFATAPSLFTYAPWGALATYADPRQQTFTYLFDPAGRLQQVTIANAPSLTHVLDANGNRLSSQRGDAPAVARTFDHWNRLATRTDPPTGAIGYDYWPNDQIHHLTYTDGKIVEYTIDGLQRLWKVKDWAQRLTTYGYDPLDQVQSVTYPNGVVSTYGYDGSRNTSVVHNNGALILAKFSVVLDPIGHPVSGANVLPSPPTLPTAGQTFTYGDGNQIVTAGAATHVYDANGNFTGIQGQPPILTYDEYGRVAAVSGTRADAFDYDADGLRTTATLGGAAQRRVYDVNGFASAQVQRGDPMRAVIAADPAASAYGDLGLLPISPDTFAPVPLPRAVDRLIELRDSASAIVQRFVHGLGVVLHETAAGYGVCHEDLAGNIVALTDSTGLPTDTYGYDPFGQPLGTTGAAPNPFRFSGRYGVIDDGNGYLYARARSFSPAQMRFVQPDYFVGDELLPQTLNRYAYATGNPLQRVDPLGLNSLWIAVGVIGGVGVVAAAIYGLAQAGAFGGGAGAGAAGSGGLAGWLSRLFRSNGYRQVPREDIELTDFSNRPNVSTPPTVQTIPRPTNLSSGGSADLSEGLRQRTLSQRTGGTLNNNLDPFGGY
jgi:RHS repeat-associated protein